MKLQAKLLLISISAILIPAAATLVAAVSIIARNRIRSQDQHYLQVIENIRTETEEIERQYADGIRRLSADEYLTSKLYVYDKYWNYIDPGTLESDILVLKGELEKFLLAEDIDTIAVYRTDYDKYRPVLVIGNPAYMPDPVYREMIDPAEVRPEYRQISDGLYAYFHRPVLASGKEIGLIVFQKSYNRNFFESRSLRYGAGIALYLQGLFRFTSLPGIAEAGVVRRAGSTAGESFTGSYRVEGKKFSYVGAYFEYGENARGYLVVGGPAAFGFGEARGIFFRLSIVPLVCMLTAAAVFLLWGNEILGHIRELLAAADRIGRGEYRVDLPQDRRDEFGELFRGFSRMAADLEENNRRLIHSEKMAALGQFSAGIAHEINNPLGIVLNHVQLLQTGRLTPEEERDFLRRIESEIRRMHGLLDDLLHGSIDSTLTMKPVSLPRLVREVAALFEPRLKARQVELRIGAAEEELTVLGDPDALKQVLFNILKNALQAFRLPGGAIDIQASGENGHWLLAITDNGEGMDEETRRRLFEPFYTRKAGYGTGLGLALSLKIMQRHGGTILVKSGPVAGTTIVLKFPRSHDHAG